MQATMKVPMPDVFTSVAILWVFNLGRLDIISSSIYELGQQKA
jgi:hypothetical protein